MVASIIKWEGVPITDRTDPQLQNFTRSGGVSYSGREQIIGPLSQRWRFSFRAPIYDAPTARAYRSILARLRGRLNYLEVGICDQYRINRADIGMLPVFSSGIPYSQPVFHSDGTGFLPYRVHTLPVAVAASSGNEIYVNSTGAIDAIPTGIFFSVDGFLYLIVGVVVTTVGTTKLTIEPALRRPITTASVVDFDAKFVGYLEDDLTGTLDLQVGRFGTATINLIEGFERA